MTDNPASGARSFGRLLAQTANEFGQDECPRQAAALSFFTVFSLPALLVVLVSILGLFLGAENADGELGGRFAEAVGPDVAAQLQTMVDNKRGDGGGGAGAVLSMIVMVFGASGVFVQIQTALNKAWSVAPNPKQGIRNFLVKRALGFAMIVAVSALLIASLVLSAVISGLGATLASGLPAGLAGPLLWGLDAVLSIGVLTLLFATVYKVLPDAQIAWRDVWVGSLFTTILFVIGKMAIGFYLTKTDPGSAFGAAGSLAVLLVWINLSSMIFFFGAELTQVWAQRFGKEIEPARGAVRVIYEKRFPEDTA